MTGVPADRIRLTMSPPMELVVGHSFQHTTRDGHFPAQTPEVKVDVLHEFMASWLVMAIGMEWRNVELRNVEWRNVEWRNVEWRNVECVMWNGVTTSCERVSTYDVVEHNAVYIGKSYIAAAIAIGQTLMVDPQLM